jgi:predicted secreted protein
MSDHTAPAPASGADEALAPPSDESNPAIIDARRTFLVTMAGAAVFIGVIYLFIL